MGKSKTQLDGNFISACKKIAISSYGERFVVEEVVGNEDKDAGTAMIKGFEIDEESEEVWAITDKGKAHLDFLVKLSNRSQDNS